MPVTLTITADTLAEALAQFAGVPLPQTTPYPRMTVAEAAAIADEAVGGVTTAEAPRTATEILMREQAEQPAKRRGRPPKNAVTTPAEDADTKPTYTVRRYGGMVEGEYGDSGEATRVLVALIHEAKDQQALDALREHNREDVDAWPAERRAEIGEAYEAALRLIQAEQVQPPERAEPAAPARGPHFALDGTVLKSLTPDKQGAMNGVNAAVADASVGFEAAKNYMASLGVPKVSALPDGDPKLALIAGWCAERLGLPLDSLT